MSRSSQREGSRASRTYGGRDGVADERRAGEEALVGCKEAGHGGEKAVGGKESCRLGSKLGRPDEAAQPAAPFQLRRGNLLFYIGPVLRLAS